jgi:cell division protein FtsB
LIAEEVEQVEPLLVTRNEDGEIEGVKYSQLTAVLVKAIQELKAENDALKARNNNLEKRLSTIEALIKGLK